VSSRQEEKERRRREREEREQAEKAKAAARRRLQLVGGGVLAVAAIAAVVIAIVASGGGSDDGPSKKVASVPIPARKITDFNAAVKASGCTYKNYPSEGREHLSSDNAVFNGYKTNPPTSGNHVPIWAQDGVYAFGNSPPKEQTVHALEHGRIEFQYAKTAPKLVQDQLATLWNEDLKGVQGYHQLVFENQTNMPYEVAATAWTQMLACKTMNPRVFDALRAFRDRFVDKGPEIVA
jgi:hypothetical protein